MGRGFCAAGVRDRNAGPRRDCPGSCRRVTAESSAPGAAAVSPRNAHSCNCPSPSPARARLLGAGLPGAACAAESAESADDWTAGLLETAAFARPFVAEIHSPQLKVELGYSKSYSEFNLTEETEKFDRPIVEAHIGAVLPLYARRWGEWSFGAMLPISVHVLEDMFDPVTAPVINTDYRFGGPRFAVMRQLSDTGFVRNFSVSWLPWFHECTHLGDEITLYRKDADLPITRINVSYEFTDLQLTLNDPAGLTSTPCTRSAAACRCA
jgi:hypothetical protein